MTTPVLQAVGGQEPTPGPVVRRVWFAQALRAVACLTVVAFHYGATFVAGPDVAARVSLFPPLTGLPKPGYLAILEWLSGWGLAPSTVALALLFLVSGFVIPYSLERGSLGSFFTRRFFRLYPTLWVVQLVVLAVLAFQAHLHHIPFPQRPATVASNALLVYSYVGHPAIESACWTLLVEEMFYAICGVCAWRRMLDKPATVVLVGLGLTGLTLTCSGIRAGHGIPLWQVTLYWLGRNASLVVFIFVGVVLHYLYRGTWRLRLGVPLTFGLLGLFGLCCYRGSLGHDPNEGRLHFRGSLAALVIFVALLLANRRLPYSRRLDRLADVSYPLYLVHTALGFVVIRAVYLRSGSLYLGFAVAFAAALALAALLHRYVERPTIEFGKSLAARLAPRADRPAQVRRAA